LKRIGFQKPILSADEAPQKADKPRCLTSPSKKSVLRLKAKVSDLLVPGNMGAWPDVRDRLNRLFGGWTAVREDEEARNLGSHSGGLSCGLDGAFAASCAAEVEGEAADERHVLGAVAAPETGLVLLEDDTEDPMEAFDAPMGADRPSGTLRGERGGGDEVAGFLVSLPRHSVFVVVLMRLFSAGKRCSPG
jgi:hypothetical protein